MALALLALSAPAGASPALVAGDVCGLLEGLPAAEDPIRQAPAVRASFRSLDRAGSDPVRLGAVHAALVKALERLLAEAERVFHPSEVPFRKWKKAHQRRAQRYLDDYLMGPRPVLRVGVLGFEPTAGLRAALLWTACRSGDREAAITWGRRASAPDEGPARAFAALLLLDAARRDEAAELLPRLGGDSFLVSFIRAELDPDPAARRQQHASAGRRRATQAQHSAWQRQKTRMEAP